MVLVVSEESRELEKKLALHVKELIEERGIKQRFVAKQLGMDEYGLSRLLKGERRFLAGYVPIFCRCLRVTPNEIFEI